MQDDNSQMKLQDIYNKETLSTKSSFSAQGARSTDTSSTILPTSTLGLSIFLSDQKAKEIHLGFQSAKPTREQVDIMTEQLGSLGELKEGIRRGFEESWEKANDLDKYRKCCDVKFAILKGKRAVRITPLLLMKKQRCDFKGKIARKIIIYAQGQALYTDFDVSIFEMCKVAYHTKAIVYALDYRTISSSNLNGPEMTPGTEQVFDPFIGQTDFAELILDIIQADQLNIDKQIDAEGPQSMQQKQISIMATSDGAWYALGALRLLQKDFPQNLVRLLILVCPDCSMLLGHNYLKNPRQLTDLEQSWAKFNIRKYEILYGFKQQAEQDEFQQLILKGNIKSNLLFQLFPGKFERLNDIDFIEKMPKLMIYQAADDVLKQDSEDLAQQLQDNVIRNRKFEGYHNFYQISYSPDTVKFFNYLKSDIDDFWDNIDQYQFSKRQRNINLISNKNDLEDILNLQQDLIMVDDAIQFDLPEMTMNKNQSENIIKNQSNIEIQSLNEPILQRSQTIMHKLKLQNEGKNYIEKLSLTLTNLVNCLDMAFEKLNQVQGLNLILAIGNTGCGKSTLLNSLIYGKEFLTEKVVETVTPNTKVKKRKVIDVQDKYKDDEHFFFFGIGHSQAKSHTFLPDIHFEQHSDYTWIDIAGLNDSSGELIYLINSFVTKQIFLRASKVKFLLTITPEQIQEQRGRTVREQIQVVMNMCQGNFDELKTTIIPILTKVKTNDHEFDIDLMRANMFKQLKQEIDKKIQSIKNQILEQEPQEEQSTSVELLENNEILEECERQLDFIQCLAYKLVVYDPLERILPGQCEQDDNQAISRQQLLQSIKDLDNINSNQLNVPLSNEMFYVLLQCFDVEMKKCYKVAQNYIQLAKQNGKSFNQDLVLNDQIVNYGKQLAFFDEKRLIQNVECRRKQYKDFIKHYVQLIDCAKKYHEMDEIGQCIFDLQHNIVVYRNQKKFDLMVKSMVELFEFLHKKNAEIKADKYLDLEQQCKFKCQQSNGLRHLEDHVTELSYDNINFYKFVYELRKFDVENKYTYEFLNGQVKPHSLVQMICANQYCSKSDKMLCDINKKSQLSIGSHGYRLTCKTDSNGIRKYMSKPQVCNLLHNHNFIDVFELVLCPTGFLIKTGNLILSIQEDEIGQEQCQSICWKNIDQLSQHQIWQQTWDLQIEDRNCTDMSSFFIQKTYGKVKPRLILKNQPTSSKGFLFTSCQDNDRSGYNEKERSIWRIFLRAYDPA